MGEDRKARYILAIKTQRNDELLRITNEQRKLVNIFRGKLKRSADVETQHQKWKTEIKKGTTVKDAGKSAVTRDKLNRESHSLRNRSFNGFETVSSLKCDRECQSEEISFTCGFEEARARKLTEEDTCQQTQKAANRSTTWATGEQNKEDTNTQTEKKISKQIEKETSKQIEEETSKQTKEETSKQTKEEPSKQTKEENSKQTKEEICKQTKEETSKQIEKEASKQTKEETSKQTKEETSKQTKEETSKQTKEESCKLTKQETSKQIEKEASKQTKEETSKQTKEESCKQIKEEPSKLTKQETSKQTKEEISGKAEEETSKQTNGLISELLLLRKANRSKNLSVRRRSGSFGTPDSCEMAAAKPLIQNAPSHSRGTTAKQISITDNHEERTSLQTHQATKCKNTSVLKGNTRQFGTPESYQRAGKPSTKNATSYINCKEKQLLFSTSREKANNIHSLHRMRPGKEIWSANYTCQAIVSAGQRRIVSKGHSDPTKSYSLSSYRTKRINGIAQARKTLSFEDHICADKGVCIKHYSQVDTTSDVSITRSSTETSLNYSNHSLKKQDREYPDGKYSNELTKKSSFEMESWLLQIRKDLRRIKSLEEAKPLCEKERSASSRKAAIYKQLSLPTERVNSLFEKIHLSAQDNDGKTSKLDSAAVYTKSATLHSRKDCEQKWHRRDSRNIKLKPSILL